MSIVRGFASDQVVDTLVPRRLRRLWLRLLPRFRASADSTRHVVDGTGPALVRFGTRPAGQTVPAHVAWAGAGEVDLAFLQFERGEAPLLPPPRSGAI